ncbi:unnamed protein product [Wuchereria bancrofti]|uniref:Uncharacterized protein n=1 Tax=Wuchereria bancrofti TaxID=6293 RepID=A0A3P7ED44_WUCBA|nr:unnamed protein product [Wuchereria bancrofti]
MKIYSGPMLWNQIDIVISYPSHDFTTLVALFRIGEACDFSGTLGVGDGRCLQLVSHKTYFIICCCWSNPLDCTYEPKRKDLFEKNKKIWIELAKIGDPALTLRSQSATISRHVWSYHDFIYSFPAKESNETDTMPGLNEPHYYCVQPLSYTDLTTRYSPVKWTEIQIEDLPPRYRFCKLSFAVLFQNSIAKSIQYKVGPDLEKKCKITRCKRNYPECLPDALRAKTVLIESSCCCASNLCSNWLQYRDYEDLTITSKYFTTLFGSCHQQLATYLRTFIFGTRDCVRNIDFRLREEISVDEHNLILHKLAESTVLVGDRKDWDLRILSVSFSGQSENGK